VIAADTKAVLVADALMFFLALLLGVWKYRQIATSADHAAHPYLDIAHRAALLYSFALLLVAVFVQLSGFSALVNLLAAGAMAFFFFASVANYSLQAYLGQTDNVFRDPPHGTSAYMTALIVAEIGGWLVLVAGFLHGQVF
jgi:glucan phosphoethanolaminetransferase (alkaline phosphatase superfamily)